MIFKFLSNSEIIEPAQKEEFLNSSFENNKIILNNLLSKIGITK